MWLLWSSTFTCLAVRALSRSSANGVEMLHLLTSRFLERSRSFILYQGRSGAPMPEAAGAGSQISVEASSWSGETLLLITVT